VTVSNEDRALVNEIVNAITWGPMLSVSTPGPDGERAINLRASAIVREVKAALIAHGWGPRPKLPSGKINDWLEVAVYAIDNADSEIRADLAAVGIEVSE
jgi:hypothetical protein